MSTHIYPTRLVLCQQTGSSASHYTLWTLLWIIVTLHNRKDVQVYLNSNCNVFDLKSTISVGSIDIDGVATRAFFSTTSDLYDQLQEKFNEFVIISGTKFFRRDHQLEDTTTLRVFTTRAPCK